jgi:hypothetical protein
LSPGSRCLRLFQHHFAKATFSPKSNFRGFYLQLLVLGLPGVLLHRDGFIADALYLIDRMGFGHSTASGVIPEQLGHVSDALSQSRC